MKPSVKKRLKTEVQATINAQAKLFVAIVASFTSCFRTLEKDVNVLLEECEQEQAPPLK